MHGNPPPTSFGQLVRARRAELGLSQRSLAGAIGVSQEWVSKIETGTIRAPRADTIIRMAIVLRLDLTDLLVAIDPAARSATVAPHTRREFDADRLRDKVAEWLRIKARCDPWWSDRHATLLAHLALDAERSTLLVRLFSGQEPLPEPPPWDEAPTGEAT